jgi:hypothetical protein
MSWSSRFIPCMALCCIPIAGAQTQVSPVTIVPVEAELLTRLDTHNIKEGSMVYARVVADWSGPGCVMAHGATLGAKVTAVTPHSKLSSESAVALLFEKAQCGKSELDPFELLLAAVAAPPDEDAGAVTTDLPAALGAGPTPGGSSAGSSTTNSLRSVDQQVDPLLLDVHRFPVTARLRSGDVLGIRGVTLRVGGGPDGSSMLISKGRDVQLDRHTRLLLMPSSVAGAQAKQDAEPQAMRADVHPEQAAGKVVQLVVRAAVSDAQPGDDVDSCAPPACNTAATSNNESIEPGPTVSFPIASLGFAPRLQTEFEAPDLDETLAYLTSTELLVAFNPHSLVPRFGGDHAGSTVRDIRAALIDVSAGRIVRTIDWHMRDDKQYLWTLAGQRVLVHVGNELRVYGPGLKVEARMALNSPLAFVRSSPNGKIIAVGVIKERHTEELHAKLRASLEQEPEEDVEILIMNASLEAVASTASTSDRLPPTMLNEGQIKLLQQPSTSATQDTHYRLQLRTWDNVPHTMARFASACTPAVSSLAPDLALLVTCSVANKAREYRVMRPDGKLVLRGQSTLNELGHAAIGDDEAREFAVRIFAADQPVLPGQVFNGLSLQTAEVAVYGSEDGKQVFNTRVREPAACKTGYALAPGGRQLAVLTRDHIALYAMPGRDAGGSGTR